MGDTGGYGMLNVGTEFSFLREQQAHSTAESPLHTLFVSNFGVSLIHTADCGSLVQVEFSHSEPTSFLFSEERSIKDSIWERWFSLSYYPLYSSAQDLGSLKYFQLYALNTNDKEPGEGECGWYITSLNWSPPPTQLTIFNRQSSTVQTIPQKM